MAAIFSCNRQLYKRLLRLSSVSLLSVVCNALFQEVFLPIDFTPGIIIHAGKSPTGCDFQENWTIFGPLVAKKNIQKSAQIDAQIEVSVR